MMKRLNRLNEIVGRVVLVTLVVLLGICAAICLCALMLIRWAFASAEQQRAIAAPPKGGLEDVRHTQFPPQRSEFVTPAEQKRSDSCLN